MPSKFWFGIAPSETGKPSLVYAFAMHDHRAQVYTFTDSADDTKTLANLVRTGDVLKIVYGVEVNPEVCTVVKLGYGNTNLEDTSG